MKIDQDPSLKLENRKYLSRHIDHLRSYGVASLLTTGAILIGVFFYAQAGLLSPPEAASNTRQSEKDDANSTIIHTDKKDEMPVDLPAQKDNNDNNSGPNTEEESIVNDIDKGPPTSQSRVAHNNNTACDEDAKKIAKDAYDTSVSLENNLHRKNLSAIGPIPRLPILSKLLGDRVATEKARHEKALEAIERTYHSLVLKAHCRP